LARFLNLTEKQPQGVLMLGAHQWARDMALSLKKAGLEVWLVDTNSRHIEIAEESGLNTIHESILSDGVLDVLPLERIGHLMALTANSELNALASIRFSEWLGDKNMYQLMPTAHHEQRAINEDLLAHILFGPEVDYKLLDSSYYNGAEVISQEIEEAADIFYEPAEILLFVISEEGHLLVPTISQPIIPKPGQTAVYLMHTDPDEQSTHYAVSNSSVASA
jgi:hypothetical protein